MYRARNLKAKDINGKSGVISAPMCVWLPCPCADPYVKVWLVFGEKRLEKKKTPVYKCNLSPTFNQVRHILYSHCYCRYFFCQTFEFDVPWEQIRDSSLDISVMDFDTIGRNELIGRLMLGCEYLTCPDR